MTFDDWLRIAQIMSTLSAPVVAQKLLLRDRATPIQSPDTNQPKRRVQLIADWIADKPKGFWWWYLFIIAIGVFNLVRSLRYPAPLDKWDIIGIVTAHVGLAFVL